MVAVVWVRIRGVGAMMDKYDREYFESLKDYSDSTDPIAITIGRLKAFLPMVEIIQDVIPSAIEMLDRERQEIINDSMKRWSDICSMIDVLSEDGESTYETASRICRFYRKENAGV